MLVDILSPQNYLNVNIKVANILGLHTAIYISELINISNENSKINENVDYFTLDPDRIRKDTTLDLDEQYQILDKLKQLKIVYEQPCAADISNNLKIDFSMFLSLVSSDDEAITDKLVKFSIKPKSDKRVSNRKKDFENLKLSIVCNNDQLRQAYYNWIDGVYANPKGFLSRAAIIAFQKGLGEFAQGDIDLSLKILEIAAVGGYRDVTWAINAYHKDYEQSFKKQQHRYEPAIITESTGANRDIIVSEEVF